MAIGKRAARLQIEMNERREKALSLRRAGLSTREIAAQLGTSHQTIHTDLKAMLAASVRENIESANELRALELERLDKMLISLSAKLREGDLKAMDRAIRIGEQRAKLLGLYMPIKQEITGGDGGPLQFEIIRHDTADDTPTD